ncbi:MAG: phosphotransferase [Candidatus Dojkabacteria bacterium]|nr:phosphotransferase [Candidatus Dojkabacteria bacterium]MDQ7021490.1 phosphotransferase [Candidatus Dojkabacteria bacterium]
MYKNLESTGVTPKSYEVGVLENGSTYILIDYIDRYHPKQELVYKEIASLIKSLKKFHSVEQNGKDNFYKNGIDYINIVYSRIKDKLEKNDIEFINNTLRYLKKNTVEPLKIVLSHGDLNPQNIIFRNDKAYLIDFDFQNLEEEFDNNVEDFIIEYGLETEIVLAKIKEYSSLRGLTQFLWGSEGYILYPDKKEFYIQQIIQGKKIVEN